MVAVLPAMVKSGRLGCKSGGGFYTYAANGRLLEPDPGAEKLVATYAEEPHGGEPLRDLEAIAHRLVLPMVLPHNGGLLNVHHTVRGYEAAGVAGIQIEDQEFPKKCGHTPGRRVIPLADMVNKIKVAVDARSDADFLIVAVPTPIDDAHQPDFSPLVGASRAVGKHMKRGAIVVYESTVYPGATEETCIPVLEQHSGMKWMRDFHAKAATPLSPGQVADGVALWHVTKALISVTGVAAALVLFDGTRSAGLLLAIPFATLTGDFQRVRSLSFDTSGRYLAAGCYVGGSIAWDLPTLRSVLRGMGLDWDDRVARGR